MRLGSWLAGFKTAQREPSTTADKAAQEQAAERLRRIAAREIAEAVSQAERQANAQANRSPELAAVIAAARGRPIVFRESYPPSAKPGLSFYGGVPIGPAGMAWPRGPADNLPLTFLMQWEGAALAEQDTTGLLPRDGVLYLFSSLRWGDDMVFRFVHEDGDTTGWGPLPVPDDLPVAWGEEAAYASPFVSRHVPVEQQRPPRLLPCWPFALVAINYPEPDGDEGDEARFWREDAAVKEVLIRAQDPDARLVPDPVAPPTKFARPFAAFPHDWAAVRVIAAAVLDKRPQDWRWKSFAPDADEAARAAMTAAWREEAAMLYAEAIRHPLGQAIPQTMSDGLWERMQAFEFTLWPFNGTVEDCVNVSLGLGSEGVAAIPATLIEAGARRHSLGYAWLRTEYNHEFDKRTGSGDALEQARATWRQSRSDEDMERIRAVEKELSAAYERAKASGGLAQVRDPWAPTPNRMLGAPSYVQGYVEEYVDELVLLLEVTNSDGIGLRLGEGVLQFMIRPDDLAARRFDRVEAVCSGY